MINKNRLRNMYRLITLLMLFISTKAMSQYGKTKWGMTHEEVKNIVPNLYKDRHFPNRLSNMTNMKDETKYVYTGYNFENDKLVSVVIHFIDINEKQESEINKYLDDVVVKQLKTKYGEPKEQYGIMNIWELENMKISTGIGKTTINNDKPTIMVLYQKPIIRKNIEDVL